jgi:prepilin-type N-terminal cleavage/methylation domain-containing protein
MKSFAGGVFMDKKGFTLIELLVVIAIIGILAAVGVPAYVGQQKRATRTEAYANLRNVRLLEEQFFAENGRYTVSKGTCAKDNAGNVGFIQGGADAMPRFQPGSGLSYSYCIEQDLRLDGTAQSGCFRASAFGNTGSRVDGDVFRIDCSNNANF